jgi:hypothetical protein
MPAETAAPKQRGRPFQKGHSGNPQGRPAGARNAATVIAEQLLEGEAATITRKAIELAKQGDLTALRLCLERIVPPRRDRPVNFALPAMSSADDASKALAAIMTAVASGDLTPTEAAELARVIDGYMKTLETADFERRIQVLEERVTRDAK